MADTDLIACLYPFDDVTGSARALIQEIENYIPPLRSPPERRRGRRDRAPTEEPEEGGGSRLDYLPCFEMRFSRGPRTTHGFVFGWDTNSDVVLSAISGISFHHLALTFDKEDRPIVQDLGSLCGTEVTYDEQGQGKRRNFCWVVGGHSDLKKRTIVINIHDTIKFQIVIPHHDIKSQRYMENVELFRRRTANTEDLFGRLNLPPETERPTGTHTPVTGPIFLQEKLGEGSFGVVTRFTNVSTFEEYALKQPSQRAIRHKDFDVSMWRREDDIMGQIDHEHIVQLIGAEYDPWPKLYLEYVPGGSLRDQENITVKECIQILDQLLSALVYLHGHSPPIVHRDIKPDNILVQYRHAGGICVKFGDFGLSREERESGHWKTICGTWKYAAPEILELMKHRHSSKTERTRYTTVVDIWSLGVVIFKQLSDLPAFKEGYEDQGTFWCQKILNKLGQDQKKRPNKVFEFLSTTMLVIEPKLRCSAQECCNGARLLSSGTEDICHNPASYTEDQELTARPQRNEHKDPQTVFRDPTRSDEDPFDSDDIQKYIRSDNPSVATHGKRAVHRSQSALSEVKETKRSRHDGLAAAKPTSQRQQEQVAPETAHLNPNAHQDPLSSRNFSGSAPHRVADVPKSAQREHLANTIQGQTGGGRSGENKGQTSEDVYDQKVAAALLQVTKNEANSK